MKPDGTYSKEFFRIVDDREKELRKLCDETTLPNVPDEKRIRSIVTDIKEAVLKKTN